MGRRQFIDKKNARVFRLVNRSVMGDTAEVDEQGNPMPERVFAEVTPSNVEGPDLGEEFEEPAEDEYIDVGSEANLMETKAGEAAKYGIFYDDREYDYTQHLKPIGKTPGAVFMAAPAQTISEDEPNAEASEFVEPPEALINRATYENIKDTGADPAVLEVLEALDDEAFMDEDGFDDDFIVKLDREEARVLAPMLGFAGKGKKNAKNGDYLKTFFDAELDLDELNLDEDFEEYYEENYGDSSYEEYYEESDEGSDVDIDGVDSFVKPFGKGGPSRLHQVDEVRKELLGDNPEPALLARILYTDDESNGEGGLELIELEVEDLNRRVLDCQSACQFLKSGQHRINRPKLIKEDDTEAGGVKPIRISRKTGMPLQEQEQVDQPERVEPAGENKGKPRPREETPEEKKARKAAIKAEKRDKRVMKKALKSL